MMDVCKDVWTWMSIRAWLVIIKIGNLLSIDKRELLNAFQHKCNATIFFDDIEKNIK